MSVGEFDLQVNRSDGKLCILSRFLLKMSQEHIQFAIIFWGRIS